MNAVSMAVNQTSLATLLPKMAHASYTFVWMGSSPVGVLTCQVSNDYSLNPNGSVNNPGNWTTLPFAANVSANSGTGGFDITTAFNAIRILYTATSGTGSLTATVAAKV